MNDNVEIIRSNKGGMKIIHRGYMYTVHKKRQGGGIRWRCTQRSLHCKGSISTGNGPPSVNMPHNHIPDPHSVALARCRQLEEFPDITSLLETEYDEIKVPSTPVPFGPEQIPVPKHKKRAAKSRALEEITAARLVQQETNTILREFVEEFRPFKNEYLELKRQELQILIESNESRRRRLE